MPESATRSVGMADALTTVVRWPARGALAMRVTAAAESVPAMAGCPVSGAPGWGGADNDPVFVLCCGRSGSTLLRFLLDAHPDLACPPETNMAVLCAHLASTWSLLAGAPVAADQHSEPTVIPEPAITGIRQNPELIKRQ